MLLKFIRVKLNERVVVFKDGLPLRALGPGRHALWGSRLTEQRFVTDALVFKALPEVRAVIPSDWYAEVAIAIDERGIVYQDGEPKLFLRPGVHRIWTVDPSVRCELYSVDEPMPKLTDELIAHPAGARVRVHAGARARARPQVRARSSDGHARPGPLRLLVAPGGGGHGHRRQHAARAGRDRRPGADDARQGHAAAVAHGGVRRGRRGARVARVAT